MAFSGALTLTDLNDYLGPSQACIKPIEDIPPPTDAQIDPETNLASTQIAIDKDGTYYESATNAARQPYQDDSISGSNSNSKPRARTKLETAAISLDDCLACSGCVTSAESVLVGLQSVEELRNRLAEIEKLPTSSKPLLYASISPQSLASLSAYLSHILELLNPIPLPILQFRVSHFLKTNPRLKFDEVVDTTFARHLSLREHSKEFLRRKEKSKRKEAGNGDSNGKEKSQVQLPMLASACPGWVCYAEKAQHELLDLVSKTKSPMLMNGVLAKRWSSPLLQSESEDEDPQIGRTGKVSSFRKRRKVFHLSVMPCYDKKLESARPSISSTSSSQTDDSMLQEIVSNLKEEAEKDVDLVLTTGELVQLMADERFELEKEVAGEAEFSRKLGLSEEFGLSSHRDSASAPARDQFLSIPSLLNHPSLHPGSSSGGYLFSVLQTVWSDYLENLPSSSTSSSSSSSSDSSLPTLLIRTIRNSDYTEYILKTPPDQNGKQQLLFKGAHCYGFRNLQNLVRKVKTQIKKEDSQIVSSSSINDRSGASIRSGKAGRGKMVGRGGRGGKMVRRGGGGGNVISKISLDDDFSILSSPKASSPSASVLGDSPDEHPEQSRNGNQKDDDDEDAFSNSIPYDYVEIMACPGGCVNGGGQLRPPTAGNSLFLNGKETKNLLASQVEGENTAPIGSFASGIGRESAMTEAKVNIEDAVSRGKEESKLNGQDEDEKMRIDQEDDDEAQIGHQDQVQKKGWKGTSKQWVGKVEAAYWYPNDREEEKPLNGVEEKGERSSTRSSSSATTRNSSNSSIVTPLTSISSSNSLPPKTSISNELKQRLEISLKAQSKRQTWTRQERESKSNEKKNESSSGIPIDISQILDSFIENILDEIYNSHSIISDPDPDPDHDHDGHDDPKAEVERVGVEALKEILFQNKYNAVKDEAVSGLAVQW